ncbi:hypothetical protein [Fimbriimonas ginsengisoli]|uniref:Uncharacterized protein n=1 Tax=Fimbriimonas ginsengisoli Gsoil 348 TaxID=661478 RepID=A0A068NS81_FIMGI|nr:hypothetical protein [Fimbriimonas ginsengisoli]AIE86408.1 hypothetical protein OP10G_3040 [Fimbriimonas ginsengisoli Gsoil 348]
MEIFVVVVLAGVVVVLCWKIIIPGLNQIFAKPAPAPPAPVDPPVDPPVPEPPHVPPPPVFRWVPDAISRSKELRSKPGTCDEMRDCFYGAQAHWESSDEGDRDANRSLMNELLKEMELLRQAIGKACGEANMPRYF